MKRLPLTIFLLSITILIIGAGCVTKKTPTNQSDVATSTAEIIKKKSKIDTSTNPAQSYCEKSSNELIIRFNETTSSSIAYCRFADMTECEVEKYFKQTCAPGQGAEQYTPPEKINNFAICTNEYEPVCGANGVTYTNTCLAQVQGIIISHTGACSQAEQQKNEPQKNPTADSVNSSANSQTKNTISTDGNTSTNDLGWLTVTKDFALSAPKSNPPAFIEKCSYSGNTSYYFSPGCDSCITTLYNKTGNIICYPSNDLDNTCPTYFTGAYRSNYCTKVWKDNRP